MEILLCLLSGSFIGLVLGLTLAAIIMIPRAICHLLDIS